MPVSRGLWDQQQADLESKRVDSLPLGPFSAQPNPTVFRTVKITRTCLLPGLARPQAGKAGQAPRAESSRRRQLRSYKCICSLSA